MTVVQQVIKPVDQPIIEPVDQPIIKNEEEPTKTVDQTIIVPGAQPIQQKKESEIRTTTEKKPEITEINTDSVPKNTAEIITNTNPTNEEKPFISDEEVARAEKFISETATFETCMKSLQEQLIDIRTGLQGRGSKNGGNYTQDGETEYKNWAGTLEKCINSLGNPKKNTDVILKNLRDLKTTSEKYYDTHFGLFGIRITPHGNERLSRSGEICKTLPSAIVVLENCIKRINDCEPNNKFGNRNLEDMKGYCTDLKETYGKMMNPLRCEGSTLKEERRVPDAHLNAFVTLYKNDRLLHSVYQYNNIDSSLRAVTDRRGPLLVSVEFRAEIYAQAEYMNRILKPGITADEAERLLAEFKGNGLSKRISELESNPLFETIQRLGHQHNPDNGFSMWQKIEKKADKLFERFKAESIADKDAIHRVGGAYISTTNSDTTTKGNEGKGGMYREAAKILTNRALCSPQGRLVLQMMALEDTHETKYNELLAHAENYLKQKNAFELGKKKNLIDVINNTMNSDIHKDILKSYLKGSLQVDARNSKILNPPKKKGNRNAKIKVNEVTKNEKTDNISITQGEINTDSNKTEDINTSTKGPQPNLTIK